MEKGPSHFGRSSPYLHSAQQGWDMWLASASKQHEMPGSTHKRTPDTYHMLVGVVLPLTVRRITVVIFWGTENHLICRSTLRRDGRKLKHDVMIHEHFAGNSKRQRTVMS